MTAVEHRNLVRKLHRRQAVRDQDRALVGNHIVELSINLVLRHGIERGGRLVEKKYLAPVIACAGNRHPLSLAARQLNGILFFSAIDTHVIPLVQYRKCGCLLAFILIYFLKYIINKATNTHQDNYTDYCTAHYYNLSHVSGPFIPIFAFG